MGSCTAFVSAEAPMKEPVAARGNILSAAAADRAAPGGNGSHSGAAQDTPADARPAALQPAKTASDSAHIGLHVSTSFPERYLARHPSEGIFAMLQHCL